jgi:hypothetical protein
MIFGPRNFLKNPFEKKKIRNFGNTKLPAAKFQKMNKFWFEGCSTAGGEGVYGGIPTRGGGRDPLSLLSHSYLLVCYLSCYKVKALLPYYQTKPLHFCKG